jgi:hypothetical protein
MASKSNKEVLICDFCEENKMKGVYATDHGPFSLCYCSECLKHKNIRTKFNGLSKWARFGEKAFDEYKSEEWLGVEPNVYFKGEYMLLRDMVDIVTLDDIENMMPKDIWLYPMVIEKIKQRLNTNNIT